MSTGTSKVTILIVDDNPDLLTMLTYGLMGTFTIVTASDGATGLEAFYRVRPECVVIDVKMPGLDGYQLVRALRGDPETAHVPLIMLTAMNQEYARTAGALVGADCYLTKPVVPSELIQSIQHVMALSKSERQARMHALVGNDDDNEDTSNRDNADGQDKK